MYLCMDLIQNLYQMENLYSKFFRITFIEGSQRKKILKIEALRTV